MWDALPLQSWGVYMFSQVDFLLMAETYDLNPMVMIKHKLNSWFRRTWKEGRERFGCLSRQAFFFKNAFKKSMHWISLEERICQCVIREWNLKNTMFVTIAFFLWNKREIPLPLWAKLWSITQGNGIWGPPVLGLFLLELKRHREKLLKDNNTATS